MYKSEQVFMERLDEWLAEQEKLGTAEHALGQTGRELQDVAVRSAANAAKLATLETKAELDRRMKLAVALGVEKPLTGPEGAVVVLLHHGKPMHVDDISREMMETGLFKTTGKTPHQTISAYLAKHAKAGDRFVRVAPATYEARQAEEATV